MFESSPPDLLVLDLQMPAPDGFAVMDLIKGWTTGDTYVPILVLTADAAGKRATERCGPAPATFSPSRWTRSRFPSACATS